MSRISKAFAPDHRAFLRIGDAMHEYVYGDARSVTDTEIMDMVARLQELRIQAASHPTDAQAGEE